MMFDSEKTASRRQDLPDIFWHNGQIYIAGKERLIDWLNSLEKKGKKRLLGFFVGLSGWYWYITGVKAAKAAL